MFVFFILAWSRAMHEPEPRFDEMNYHTGSGQLLRREKEELQLKIASTRLYCWFGPLNVKAAQ